MADSQAAIRTLARTHGLGVSAVYPGSISNILELEGTSTPGRFERARRLVERLATLPVHHYVERTDIERICLAIQATTESASASDIGREQVLSTGRVVYSGAKFEWNDGAIGKTNYPYI